MARHNIIENHWISQDIDFGFLTDDLLSELDFELDTSFIDWSTLDDLEDFDKDGDGVIK